MLTLKSHLSVYGPLQNLSQRGMDQGHQLPFMVLQAMNFILLKKLTQLLTVGNSVHAT
jgi:hypothetical protein